MSKSIAMAVVVLILAGQIALHLYGFLDEKTESMIHSMVVMIQGWMTYDAYHRNPDGTRSA